MKASLAISNRSQWKFPNFILLISISKTSGHLKTWKEWMKVKRITEFKLVQAKNFRQAASLARSKKVNLNSTKQLSKWTNSSITLKNQSSLRNKFNRKRSRDCSKESEIWFPRKCRILSLQMFWTAQTLTVQMCHSAEAETMEMQVVPFPMN